MRGDLQKNKEIGAMDTAPETTPQKSKQEKGGKVKQKGTNVTPPNAEGVLLKIQPVKVICPTSKLDKEEELELERLEKRILRGWQTFLQVGKALTVIRDKKLYRNKYKKFPEYCLQKWHYGRSYAYRLIGATEVGTKLLGHARLPPTNEAQIRPLIGLPMDQCFAIWKQAEEMAEARGKPIQASWVRKLVKEKKSGHGKGNRQKRTREGSLIKFGQLQRILEKISHAKTLTAEHNIRSSLDVLSDLEVEVARMAEKLQAAERNITEVHFGITPQ